ncbi:MAG TPA: 2-phosphosulfolactate phosphatase [Candidatus Hydrogenedens sp.]|mgnify:FL=1|nr:2-phosphosulfolactate phosphatase [Candidatus Hydrogenedens sp.]
MLAHIIQGREGCIYGKENHLGIIIVDALRASATASMLLHHGATKIFTVAKVDTARQLKHIFPNALLYGERNGLPPEGFNFGNSPQETVYAKGKEVIFTTTTGARLLFEAYRRDVPFIIMSTTINAKATIQFLKKQNKDFVIVPAGLFDTPEFSAQEDWVSASFILQQLEISIGCGRDIFEYWVKRIEKEGIKKLFQTAPHADKLRTIGLKKDIYWCARTNITNSIPIVTGIETNYLILENAHIP